MAIYKTKSGKTIYYPEPGTKGYFPEPGVHIGVLVVPVDVFEKFKNDLKKLTL